MHGIHGIKISTPYSCKVLKETSILSTDIRKKAKISNLMKIRPVEVELFHAERRSDRLTHMKILIVAFRDFVKAPKMTATAFIHSQCTAQDTERKMWGLNPCSCPGFVCSPKLPGRNSGLLNLLINGMTEALSQRAKQVARKAKHTAL
jgi:hypothetical protein